MTDLEIAQQLDSWGLNVLPARRGGKAPQIGWEPYQTQRTTKKLRAWFTGGTPHNWWVVTGRISGVVVLDIDSDGGETYWREQLGDETLDTTACATTAKGRHYYFKHAHALSSWSAPKEQRDSGIAYDVRADGTGVIVPPSIHESGVKYEWVRGLECALELPDALRGPSRAEAGTGGGGQARSMLSELLDHPPRGEDSGRNNWLTRVAGHYAKHFRRMKDAYETHVRHAADMLDTPLPEIEITKVVESIWKTEHKQTDDDLESPNERNGFLVRGDACILVQTRYKDADGEQHIDVAPWADFDIRAIGVVEDDDANRTYDVEILRRRQGDVRRGLLPASRLARGDAIAAWLGEFGVGVLPPDNMWPRAGGTGERLRRYLEAQDPPQFQVVDHLGWHQDGGGFVAHEGVIRADGLHGHEHHKPDPRLRNWAPYRYGFMDETAVVRALREVLTFHDETVCSVYGAWWIACLLKPQIHDVVSQFPFMALEAPSESGKTTGFFGMMLQLAGNTQGQVDPTRASLRDSMSAHASGIVWIDDLSDMQHLMDLLRQATGEGSVAKKGEDRTTQAVVRLVAPIAISGEALQLGGQKALMDRAVMLEVPSPTSRRSLHDPDRLQWLDIVELRRRYPDLTAMAGTIVQMTLQHADMVHDLPSLVPPEGGRYGDKIAVVRLGARVLAAVTGDEHHIDRVERWCVDQEAVGSENALTLRMIPEALARTGWLRAPERAEGRWPATPAFVDKNKIVWFSASMLAAWWSEINRGHVEKRTETADALVQQARALGLSERRRFRLSGDHERKLWYWSLGLELSKVVVMRSRGDNNTRGVFPEQHRLALEATRVQP